MVFSPASNIEQSSEVSTPTLTEALVANAIADVVGAAKANGRSLKDVTAEVLFDDQVLDPSTRYWLSGVVSQAWNLPIVPESSETISKVA